VLRASAFSDWPLMTATTGIAGCCARAASGHETADPTILVMKSRRRITLPSFGYRQLGLPIQAHQNRNLRPAKCDEMVSFCAASI
jgi:hypothetical protein